MPTWRSRLLNASISAVVGVLIVLVITLVLGKEFNWLGFVIFFVLAFVIDLFAKTTPIWRKKNE